MSDTHELATETDKRLAVHEAICATRYEGIQKRFDDGSKRMQRIEYILYFIAALTFVGPGYAVDLLKKLIVLGG
jgi:hypothetical protein